MATTSATILHTPRLRDSYIKRSSARSGNHGPRKDAIRDSGRIGGGASVLRPVNVLKLLALR
jgi:hypothetical protein